MGFVAQPILQVFIGFYKLNGTLAFCFLNSAICCCDWRSCQRSGNTLKITNADNKPTRHPTTKLSRMTIPLLMSDTSNNSKFKCIGCGLVTTNHTPQKLTKSSSNASRIRFRKFKLIIRLLALLLHQHGLLTLYPV